MSMQITFFGIQLSTFLKTSECVIEVPIILINFCQILNSPCIFLIVCNAFCKIGNSIFLSVQIVIDLADPGNHIIILRIRIEILKKISKRFFLFRRGATPSQSFVDLAVFRVYIKNPSKAFHCLFPIFQIQFIITTTVIVIIITIIDTCQIPQGRNMLRIKLKDLLVGFDAILRNVWRSLFKQSFSFCLIFKVIHLINILLMHDAKLNLSVIIYIVVYTGFSSATSGEFLQYRIRKSVENCPFDWCSFQQTSIRDQRQQTHSSSAFQVIIKEMCKN